MPKATRLPLLLTAFAVFSWPAMMGLHELGHVFGAALGGGTVREVVWHPLRFSRTDVQPDPHPLLTVWAGPLVGVALPLLADGIAAWRRWRSAHHVALFSGFCLLANGAYIGLGVVDRLGDTEVMHRHGTSAIAMLAFGVPAFALGLWRWHRASPRLKEPIATSQLAVFIALAAAIVSASVIWSAS